MDRPSAAAASRLMWGAQQLPDTGAEDRVGFRHGHGGADEPGRGAVGGFEHGVYLGLGGGGVFVQVGAEGQQAAGEGHGARPGYGAGQGEDHAAGPQVRPAAQGCPVEGGARAGGGEFGGEAVEEGGEAAQPGVREHGGDDLGGAGDHVVVEALPAGAGQVAQPGAGGGQQVRCLFGGAGRCGRLGGGAAGDLVGAGGDRVVRGAEQGGAGGGQGGEVVLAGGARGGLVGGLGDPRGERARGDRVGEGEQPFGLVGSGSQEARDEGPVEGVDGGEGLVQAVDGCGEQVGAHQATALVDGNQCISGSGAVVAASSR
ncbi:hypothetical protein GCM10020256_73090 [Streptomyces thermocoprophilus]